MKIGFLCTAYNCADFLIESLAPFAQYKSLVDVNHKISVIHSVFQEYYDLGQPILSEDGTEDRLNKYHQMNNPVIDYLHIADKPLDEASARNMALKPLLEDGCDLIFLVDLADELYTLNQIVEIIDYVKKNPDIAWFKLSLRNYFQTENQYLEEPFCPPRIWRVNPPPFSLAAFTWDNDVAYHFIDRISEDDLLIKDKSLINKTIKNIPVKHFSWMNDQRSKLKIQYQNLHFKGVCSYIWNESNNSVEFNPFYYKDKPLPNIIKES